MTEDDKLVYDYESDWRPCNSGKDKIIIFKHDKCPSLFRIVNFHDETITYSDIERVEKITDINKVLVHEDDKEENMRRYLPIVNTVLNEVKPIILPYKKEHLNAYIEAFPGFDRNFDDTVGVLYFWNKPDEKVQTKKGVLDAEMIPAKRFFRIHPIGSNYKYEEINYNTYNDVKSKWFIRMEKEKENVDKA